LIPRRSIAISSTLLLTAVSMAVMGFLTPAVAGGPGDNGQAVHVYPGAEPLTHDNAGQAAAPPATGEAPEQPQPSVSEPQAPQAGDSGTEPIAPAAVKATEEDPQAQEAQLQTTAAQHYELAAHYFGKWDLDLAEVEMDETVSLYPDFRIAHRDLCLISAAKFNFSRSLAEFMMVTGLTDPLPYSAADKVLLDNKAMHMHYKKALSLGNRNKWNDAIAELLWAQSYAPGDAAIHHSLAFAYASEGDFTNAEREYKTTFSNAPQDGFAHADFANMLADHGQAAKAEDEMRKAIELAPNAAALHVDLGWLAESHKDLPTAENEFKAAVKLSPQHAGLWTHLGRIMESQGQTAPAQEAYLQALKLDQQNEEARTSLDRLKQLKPAA
jgi:Tfp pilus assembly protein PilF